jgi:hypothetical protein
LAPSTGWSVTKIIQQCHGRTENRCLGKPVDWYMEFWQGLDEFCQEKHYWWRRKTASFQTVIGQQDYDLSSAAGGNAGDCEEIEEAYAINAPPITGHARHVHPKFTARAILTSIYGVNAVPPTPIPSEGYFLVPGEFQQWSFSQIPQTVFTVGFTYWAVPMIVAPGVQNDVVPLVPPYLHWGLTYVLERRMYEYLYGQNDPRFVTSNARYEQFKAQAAKSKQFSSQEAIHSNMQGRSVVSAGGRGRPGSLYGCR